MENPDFCQGLIIGIAVAGLLGLLLQQMSFHHRKMQAPGRPMRTFPPEDTPGRVVRASYEAACIYYVLIVVLGVVLVLVTYMLLRGLG
jgi:hypothetical protein